jgi:hypothetical protein
MIDNNIICSRHLLLFLDICFVFCGLCPAPLLSEKNLVSSLFLWFSYVKLLQYLNFSMIAKNIFVYQIKSKSLIYYLTANSFSNFLFFKVLILTDGFVLLIFFILKTFEHVEEIHEPSDLLYDLGLLYLRRWSFHLWSFIFISMWSLIFCFIIMWWSWICYFICVDNYLLNPWIM